MNSNATKPFFHNCPALPNDPTTMTGELSRWLMVGIGILVAVGVFRLVDRIEQFDHGFPQDNNMGAYVLAKEIEHKGPITY
jgi:hypothetical protein